MNKTYALILVLVCSSALGCSRSDSLATATSLQSPLVAEQRPVAPPSCPVTAPPTIPFTPSGEREMGANDKGFWWGTEKLWLFLLKSRKGWGWLPRGPGKPILTTKIFWGSADFDYRRKEDYDLKVTGRRLDGDAPPLVVSKVTNALFEPHAAMLTGVWVPTPGCWEITGERRGEKLSFVVWVYPVKQ